MSRVTVVKIPHVTTEFYRPAAKEWGGSFVVEGWGKEKSLYIITLLYPCRGHAADVNPQLYTFINKIQSIRNHCIICMCTVGKTWNDFRVNNRHPKQTEFVGQPCHRQMNCSSEVHVRSPLYPRWGYASDFKLQLFTPISKIRSIAGPILVQTWAENSTHEVHGNSDNSTYGPWQE